MLALLLPRRSNLIAPSTRLESNVERRPATTAVSTSSSRPDEARFFFSAGSMIYRSTVAFSHDVTAAS
jgi:hypothetical protein